MSLEIYINDVRVKIPNNIPIAYNLENFDITDIGNRKLNYTNSFQIPAAGNEAIFGFASDIATTSVIPYSQLSIDIIADGIKIVDNGSGFIKNYSDGYYNIQVTEGKDVVQTMKDTLLAALYDGDTVVVPGSIGNYGAKVLLMATTGFKLDIIMTDRHIADDAPTNDYVWDKRYDTLSVYVKTVFEKYETEHSVTFAGDLWTDTYFEGLRMNVFYCVADNDFMTFEMSLSSIILDPTKSFYDLFREVLKIFGATYKVSGTVITMSKLDNISKTVYTDWSGKTVKINNKEFSIPNTSQINYIRYSPAGGTDKTMNQSVVTSNNLNIRFETELMTIDASVYPIIFMDMYALYSDQETVYWKENDGKFSSPDIHGVYNILSRPVSGFVFFTNSADDMFSIDVTMPDTGSAYTPSAGEVFAPTYFNSQNEYNLLFDMLYNPVFYEVEMQLNILDIAFFDPMKLVFISELGGLFYVNSIKDYLLNSPDKTATVELIKINTYTP